jgi:DNA-binding CsgD family transcriptional regulator
LGDRGEESRLWREVQRPHGVADVASVVFKDRFGCWGFLDLWRSTRFGPGDTAFLDAVAAPLTTALRRCQAHTFAARPAGGPHGDGPVVLLPSADLQVRSQTPETQDYLRVLVPPAPGRPPVPAGAYNVAAQLIAREAGVDDHPPLARVHLSDGLWVTARAARMGDDIAVTIEETTPAGRLAVFARASGLSAREAELLGLLVGGADTRQVAGRMYLSEHTVQDHLKSIFTKTSVNSRRALLARVLGA